MLDLHFSDQSVFKSFEILYVSGDFGKDLTATVTTLIILIQRRFDLTKKIDIRL